MDQGSLLVCQNFKKVKGVGGNFDPEEAVSITECKQILPSEKLHSTLTFIRSRLAVLPSPITTLETTGLSLIKALQVVNVTKRKIDSIPGDAGQLLKSKVDTLRKKDLGLKTLTQIGGVSGGGGKSWI